LNTVAIVAGILSQFDFHYSQHNNHFNRVDSWYMANGVFGVLHILAAIYIVYRIEKPLSSTKASATQQGFDYRLDNEAPPHLTVQSISKHMKLLSYPWIESRGHPSRTLLLDCHPRLSPSRYPGLGSSIS
jgi:hypothetical protein